MSSFFQIHILLQIQLSQVEVLHNFKRTHVWFQIILLKLHIHYCRLSLLFVSIDHWKLTDLLKYLLFKHWLFQ